MDDQTFRQAMSKFATGVTVITTAKDYDVHGMTANAFMSVSLNPKLITVSVSETARLHEKMKQTEAFAVNILPKELLDISLHFSGKKTRHSVGFSWMRDVPIIDNALANIICRKYDAFTVGDHTLFIGEVMDLKVREGKPLIFFGGKFVDGELDTCKAI